MSDDIISHSEKELQANYIYSKHFFEEAIVKEETFEDYKKHPLINANKKIFDESIRRYVDKSDESKEILKEAYDKIIEALSFYLDIEEDKKKVMALWVIGTYFHEEFNTFPLLFLNAMKGSAKSRTIKLLTKLCKDGQLLMNISESALFRSEGTLGIDEFENLISKEKQTLRELLNASYKKGSQIVRMKKKKTNEGEEFVKEYFNAYRPIIMANINGIEEVLSDRSVTIILEKSNNVGYIKLMENYDDDSIFNEILLLLSSEKCSLCSVVTKNKQHNYTNWNNFVKQKTTLSTFTTLTTLTTLTTQEQEIYEKIYNSDINGRNLELYYPIYMIALSISEKLFDDVLEISKRAVDVKRNEDMYESTDINLYQMVSECDENYIKITDLVYSMKSRMGEGNFDWLNAKWMGRGLKRLNLVIDKRRVAGGMMVRLNVNKAKEKLEMFK